MLQQLIYWSSFGPDDYYIDLMKRPQGRPPRPKKERFLIETRFDKRVPSNEVREWGYRDFNKEFDPENTYPAAQATLSAIFNEVWGDAIVNLLALLYPFRAHHDAVAHLRAKHRDETDHGALAWRALFDGQGVLWTLETYAKHRAELRDDLRKVGQTLPKVRIESAYNTICNEWIPKEFEPRRASTYLSKAEDALTEDDRALVNGNVPRVVEIREVVSIVYAAVVHLSMVGVKARSVHSGRRGSWSIIGDRPSRSGPATAPA